MFNKNLLFFLLFICFCSTITAQDKPAKKDSTKVYQNIEDYSKKRKFTKFVHKLLFRTPKKAKAALKNKKNPDLIKRSFDLNEGKIIRKIEVETLDPFGYSILSKNDVPDNGVEKFGNHLHLKTKNFTIRNLLLFKKNNPLDSLLVKESERLIRKQRYVRSVIIKPIEIENSKDSIDISIRVLDSWSLIPTGSISGSKANFEITERNFLGLGHELENNFSTRFDDKAKGNSIKYTINNVSNSFINTSFYYENDFYNNTRKNAKIERIFYSPLTHWAGGVFFENRFYRDSLPSNFGVYQIQRFKLDTQNYWVGFASKLFPGKSINYRTTNFVTTLRFQNINYSEKPNIVFDESQFFNSEKIYLTSIGITTRKFAEEKYLFNFGTIEDVPLGQVYSLTTGFQDKSNRKRAYFGARFAYGNYFSFGYLAANIEYGSFINNGISEETTMRIESNYFTNIFHFGNWKIRQFIKPTVVFGTHRDKSIKDRLNINETNGLGGFNSSSLIGTKKWIASFQTQTYSPGNWKGFHFNPFFNVSIGMVGNDNNLLFDKKMYTSIGLGILINNDYLVFNSFQLSFSFYPSVPNEGNNIFKTNSFKNNDISVPDYQIGMPTIVPFN
ncbi:hypothetical protein [Flavobacterium sp.]|uniref:hypothetical protein n=1 Tax=Flavobacterium sp. TaxID=239 RepID=UPI003750395B